MTDLDNCKSYNAQIGTVEEVILPRPNWMPEGERLNGVPVDACLAKVIQTLWDHGFTTLGCCCGHGGRIDDRPSIILGESEYKLETIRKLIASVDDRDFKLQQWELVTLGEY